MNYGRNSTSQKRASLQAQASARKKRKKKRVSSLKTALLVILGIAIAGLITAGVLFKKIIDDTPKITTADLVPSAYTTTFYASDGTTKLTTLVDAGGNRVFKSLDKIPVHLQKAFIAVEDTRFYDHKGVDWKGIARAAVTGITSGHFSQGGSTITQQLIKNTIFPNFSTETGMQKIERKIQELYLALQVERTIDKDKILENYLNAINLGQNTLGVQAAAQRYFGKDVEDLTLSECVTIAAITKSPSGYNPITNPEANAKRREKVLRDMLAQGYITEKEKEEALADDVYARIQETDAVYKANVSVNSYFVDEAIKEVINDLIALGHSEDEARHMVYSGGLKIITTQDATMQKICEEELNRAENYPEKVEWTISGAISVLHEDGTQNHYDHNSLGKYVKNKYNTEYGTTFNSKETATAMLEEYIETIAPYTEDTVITNITITPQPQASFVIMDQYTGHVKAMVGGRGEKTSNMTLNRATQSARQPGSCFKILSTFVPALDVNGDTLLTTIVDEYYEYENTDIPVNNWWEDGFRGAMSIRKCIQESANICSVKKYTEIGYEIALKYLTENFALTTIDMVDDSGPATALGGITNGVYNIEMTAAYAAIANNGVYIEPILYTHIYDSNNNLIYEKSPKTQVALKQSTAYLITSAMRDVVTKGTGKTARLSGVATAGKTGTTSDSRDYWFSGYTPYLTASVWMGYDTNQPMNQSYFHTGIWRKVMQRIHDTYDYKSQAFEKPDDVISRSICQETGLLASGDSCKKYTEYFAKGTGPKKTCPGHAPSESEKTDAEKPNAEKPATTPAP